MMIKSLVRLTVFLAILASLAVWVSLRSFRVFLEEDLVAVVQCEAAPIGASYGFLIEVKQMTGGVPGPREKFPMMGDQWSMGGDILKWKPWLVVLGAKSCHKLTRLNSRYGQARDEMKKPRAVYDLNGGSTLPWRWLYRWGVALPFVDAVYGNAVYVPIRTGRRWGVTVTHSGYLIRPLKGSPS